MISSAIVTSYFRSFFLHASSISFPYMNAKKSASRQTYPYSLSHHAINLKKCSFSCMLAVASYIEEHVVPRNENPLLLDISVEGKNYM